MGKRGPKPGFLRERAAKAEAEARALEEQRKAQATAPNDAQQQPAATSDDVKPPEPPTPKAEPEPTLSHADRHNPAKLTGDALKDYAYRYGIPRSQMVGQSDERIRLSLRYLVSQRAEEEAT